MTGHHHVNGSIADVSAAHTVPASAPHAGLAPPAAPSPTLHARAPERGPSRAPADPLPAPAVRETGRKGSGHHQSAPAPADESALASADQRWNGSMVQLLDSGGVRAPDDHSSHAARAARLSAEDLRTMLRQMVLTRRFDAEATSLQRQGELGLWPQSLGQEAAQIGSAHALNPRDVVFPSYREHGVALARGVDVRQMLGLFRGVDQGGWDPRAHNFGLYTLVIGSHVLHATGYAMGVQRDGDVGTTDPTRDRAVVAYFGDGATSQGDVNEALVFAAAVSAPVVFFCQNNQWAISAPTSVQSRVPLARRGEGFGVPSVQVDGNDALACWAVTAEALERARAGGGPTFIEAVTYRMGAHTTSDDPTRYRTSGEEESWRRRDPIDRLRTHLSVEGLIDDAFEASLQHEADVLAVALREYCRALTPPDPRSMFEHVYGADHPLVAEERAWFEHYEASFADSRTQEPR